MSGYHTTKYFFDYDTTRGLGVKHVLWEFPKGMGRGRVLPLYSLSYCVAGGIRYEIEGTTYDVTAGDLVLLDVGERHRMTARPGTFCERIVAKFSPEWLRQIDPELRLARPFTDRRHGCGNVIRMDSTSGDFASRCLFEMVRPDGNAEMQTRTCLPALLWQVCEAFERTRPEGGAAQEQEDTLFLRVIDENLNRFTGVEGIAEKLGISRATLYRRVKEMTGVSAWQYVAMRRAAMAQELLGKGLRAADVSRLCGFQDYSTFYRTYKRIYGTPPRKENE